MDIGKMLYEQKQLQLKGNLYHFTQINMAYNTNRIEGSKLTEEETRYIYETNTIMSNEKPSNIDDIIETVNHFKAFDYMLDVYQNDLSQEIIKQFHYLLKRGTSQERLDWFKVGDYKSLPNEVGGKATIQPEQVKKSMEELLDVYNNKEDIVFEDIVNFHYNFESIHPFQDGNGRVGRLIMFKECLKNNITPFIIDEQHKFYYYRGLKEYSNQKGYILDTCLSAQDNYTNVCKQYGVIKKNKGIII